MQTTPIPYIVCQGETLLSIALARGLEPTAIWDEPKNAELKRKRDPDMLAPGDVLYLPPPARPRARLAPKQANRFQATVPKVKVRLKFRSEKGPMKDEPYEIRGLGDPKEGPKTGTLDGTGLLDLEVPLGVEHFTLVFPKRLMSHEVWVGHLDPFDEKSGMRQRLLHLGYLPVRHRPGDPYTFPDAETEALTIRWFQRANGLEATGIMDEATLRKLDSLSKAGSPSSPAALRLDIPLFPMELSTTPGGSS